MAMIVTVSAVLLLSGFALVTCHPHCSTPGLCQNGGTCVEAITSAYCLCPLGFTGHTCSEVDYCSSSPCQNGGACQSLTSSYSCTCLVGYTGTQCQTAVSACASSPCLHGQCQDMGVGFECQCHAGYTGTLCDVEMDYCSSAPCGRHGTCVEEQTGGYSCHCQSDYLGLNCDQHISQRCGQDEESFCMCEVNGSPVKVPIPAPAAPQQGANTRDVIMGMTGLLLGWTAASGVMALYRCCCRGSNYLSDSCCAGGAGRRYPASPRSVRPASTSTTVSTLDSLRGDSPDSRFSDSHHRPPPSTAPTSASSSPSNAVVPAPSSSPLDPSAPRQGPRNVYRAGFIDNLSHQTADRKSADTYHSGQKDW